MTRISKRLGRSIIQQLAPSMQLPHWGRYKDVSWPISSRVTMPDWLIGRAMRQVEPYTPVYKNNHCWIIRYCSLYLPIFLTPTSP